MARKLKDFLSEHRKHFLKKKGNIPRSKLERGDVVNFRYKTEERFVFVIHPDWQGKLHGLDINHLPRRDLLPLFDAKSSLNSEQFYNEHVDKSWVKRWDAYRTYDLLKMGPVTKILYNNQREEDEMSEPRMDDEPKRPLVPDEDILPNK